MNVDLTGLTEVKMQKAKGWQGSYFLDVSGECVAKTCSKCRRCLPAALFSKDAGRKYGLLARCRECGVEFYEEHKSVFEERRRAYQPKDPEVQRRRKQEYRLERRANGTDTKQRLASRTIDEVLIDRAELRPEGVKYCTKCQNKLEFDKFSPDLQTKDGLNFRCRQCAAKHYTQTKRSRLESYWSAVGGPITCYVCGAPWKHADHVVPERLGGCSQNRNLLPLCVEHNTSKQDTPLLGWLRERHPEKVEEVMTRVLSYGVRPYTRLDVWTEVPADHVPRIEIQVK